MAVRNWEEQRLGMDFEHICVLCSDIDMVHVTNGGKLIIGEIKNHKGTFGNGQRNLLTGIVDKYKYGGAVLFIEHYKDVHAGDKVVDVAACEVKEYYTNGRWFKPKQRITVNEVMNLLEEKQMGATIEGKAKVWAKDHDWGTTYTIGVSSKDQNGNWVNAYQPVRFRKDTPKIESGTEIQYKGFATVSKGKEYPYVIWQITEFTFVGNETANNHEPSFSQLTENDVPF